MKVALSESRSHLWRLVIKLIDVILTCVATLYLSRSVEVGGAVPVCKCFMLVEESVGA